MFLQESESCACQLDQSVTGQVGWFSKMCTHSQIWSITTDLDSSNSLLSSLSHLKGVPDLSDWWNGTMHSVAAKAFDINLVYDSKRGVHIGDV